MRQAEFRVLLFLVIVLLVWLLGLLLISHQHDNPRLSGGVASKETSEHSTVAVPEIKSRLIAVGDIHGDINALHAALQLAGLLCTEGKQGPGMHWCGGTTILIQIGDLVNNHGDGDLSTLKAIIQLQAEAKEAGGQVYVVLGDHDIANLSPLLRQLSFTSLPIWMRPTFVHSHTVFVHGSLTTTASGLYKGNLTQLDADIRPFMNARLIEQTERDIKLLRPSWLPREDGPIWSRLYSRSKEKILESECTELSYLINSLNTADISTLGGTFKTNNKQSIQRMVVGHTVRTEGISVVCDGLVWRIDVGLGASEGRAGRVGASEVLEIVVTAGSDTTSQSASHRGISSQGQGDVSHMHILMHEGRAGKGGMPSWLHASGG